jgi:hypothetical protein
MFPWPEGRRRAAGNLVVSRLAVDGLEGRLAQVRPVQAQVVQFADDRSCNSLSVRR